MVGLVVGLLNIPALFHAGAFASRVAAPAAVPAETAVPTLAEMALGLTGGLPLGDLAGLLPVLGETASVLPVAGGTGAGGSLLDGLPLLGGGLPLDGLPLLGGGSPLDGLPLLGVGSPLDGLPLLGGGSPLDGLPLFGGGRCGLPTGDVLGTVNGALGGVTGILSGLPLLGELLGRTTGGGLLGTGVASVNQLVESAPLAGEIAAQATC
ncbi:MAG: hypothetical protein ACRDZ3_08905 [Acidimicrobiia bacterium]